LNLNRMSFLWSSVLASMTIYFLCSEVFIGATLWTFLYKIKVNWNLVCSLKRQGSNFSFIQIQRMNLKIKPPFSMSDEISSYFAWTTLLRSTHN
jgi:hypothetical protein